MPTNYHGHNSRGSIKHPIFQKALNYGHEEVLAGGKDSNSLGLVASVALGLVLLFVMV
jgi:hypothetical protein